MIIQVAIKPNPFTTIIQLDVTCEISKQVIVRMFNDTGMVVKMFSWYLVKGTNVTAIGELNKVQQGIYMVDIINHDGEVLYSTRLTKH